MAEDSVCISKNCKQNIISSPKKRQHGTRDVKKNEENESDQPIKSVSEMSDAIKKLVKHNVKSSRTENIKEVVDEAVKTELKAGLTEIYN